jgi:hypothetical protein
LACFVNEARDESAECSRQISTIFSTSAHQCRNRSDFGITGTNTESPTARWESRRDPQSAPAEGEPNFKFGTLEARCSSRQYGP